MSGLKQPLDKLAWLLDETSSPIQRQWYVCAMLYQRALVTGASSGLGRGLSLWFAERGATVFAGARRMDALETLREEAARAGGRVEPVLMDVAKTKALVGQIEDLDRRCGGFDLVIANAGVGAETSGRALDWKQVERILQVNIMGAAATVCAAIPAMVARNRGHVVGISSIAAYRGLPKNAAYCGSKAFLKVFLESLRVDLRPTGVRVTSIHPGFVKTPLTAKNQFPMPFLLENEEACEQMGKAILQRKREFVLPWPMALASRALSAIPNAIYDVAAQAVRGGPLKK